MNTLELYGQCKHTALGAAGECWAAQEFARRGFLVHDDHTLGDLVIVDPGTGEIIVIEVKTCRVNSDGKYRANLQKKGHCSHRKSDFVLLVTVTRSGAITPFLVPVLAVWNIRCLSIGSDPRTYAGKYSQYRNQWP